MPDQFRSFTILGSPNYVARDYCTVTTPDVDFEPADMPPELLKTEEPSDIARITTVIPQYTQWLFGFNHLASNFDGFALDNHNLTSGGLYRIIGTTQQGTQNTYTSSGPTSIASSTNLTGVVGNIDEDERLPDASYIGPNDVTAAWTALINVPADNTPLTGAHRCKFVLFVTLFGNGAGLTDPISYPLFQAKLYENNIELLDLGTRAVTSTTGQYFIFSFDAALLATASGSNIQIQVLCTTGDSDSGNTYARLDLVRLNSDTENYLFDTGWLESQATEIGFESDGLVPKASLSYFPEERVRLASFSVMICDDKCMKNPLTDLDDFISIPGVPVGVIDLLPEQFIQAGLCCAGEAISLTYGIPRTTPPGVRLIPEGIPGYTQSGQAFSAGAFSRRGTEILNLVVTREENNRLLDLFWRKQQWGGVFISIEPDIPDRHRVFSDFWAVATSYGPSVQIVGQHYSGVNENREDLFSFTVQFEEKL